MSKLKERLDKARREGIPRSDPKLERERLARVAAMNQPKPSAEVVALPQGPALAIVKQERTRTSEIDRDRRDAERYREQKAEAVERYMNSEAYVRAGTRFNAELAREREADWFDPRYPGGFRQ